MSAPKPDTVIKKLATFNRLRQALKLPAIPDLDRFQQYVFKYFTSMDDFVLQLSEYHLSDVLLHERDGQSIVLTLAAKRSRLDTARTLRWKYPGPSEQRRARGCLALFTAMGYNYRPGVLDQSNPQWTEKAQDFVQYQRSDDLPASTLEPSVTKQIPEKTLLAKLKAYNLIRAHIGFDLIDRSKLDDHVLKFFRTFGAFVLQVTDCHLHHVFRWELQKFDYKEQDGALFWYQKNDYKQVKNVMRIFSEELKTASFERQIEMRLQYKEQVCNRLKALFENFGKSADNDIIEHVYKEMRKPLTGADPTKITPRFVPIKPEAPEVILDDDLLHEERQRALQAELLQQKTRGTLSVTRSTTKAGFVYVVTSPQFPGWVKIGSTMNLDERLVAFNVHNPYGDFTYSFYNFFDFRVEAERTIHAKFEEARGSGEWFRLDPETVKSAILLLAADKSNRDAA